ncbi:TPA: hypothetical protein DCG61_00210 [Patescibacteria group bacterium]|jgi:hypothetical protein|nr:hypothetical protein [Patescibacteria group bacterium]
MLKFSKTLIITAMVWFIPTSLFAASVSFEPPSLVANQAKPFSTTVILNTEGQNLNAIDGTILISEQLASGITLSDSGSVVTYWVQRPEWNAEKRAITFSGTIPGGYTGQAGILFTIIFPPRLGGSVENAAVVASANSYLNDGLGTPARVSVSSFSLETNGAAPVDQEIKDQLFLDDSRPDNIPPEVFSPQVARDDNVFDGKWFINFATTDKQSGISHYEIQETRSGRLNASGWKQVESPYLLQDQDLHSFIYVVAVDRQGNERMIKVFPRNPLTWWQRYSRDLLIGLGLLVVVTTAVIVSRSRNNQKEV